MDGTPGIDAAPKLVKTAPVGVVSLSLWRVYDAFASTRGKNAALATSRSVRASVMRSTAARRSRFEAVLRSISDTSIGSWKVVHQVTTACGSVLRDLVAVAAGDHCGGTRASGRVKFGPTEHPSGMAASVISSSRVELDVLIAIIGISGDAVAEHPSGATQGDRRDQRQRPQIVRQQRKSHAFEVDTPRDIDGIAQRIDGSEVLQDARHVAYRGGEPRQQG